MESLTHQGTVIAQRSLYIHRVRTTSGNVLTGSLGYRSKVSADRIQDGWWHLTRINGAPVMVESWACEGVANAYIRSEAAVVTSPPSGRTFAYVYRNYERPDIGVSRPTQNRSALRTGGLEDVLHRIRRAQPLPVAARCPSYRPARCLPGGGQSLGRRAGTLRACFRSILSR
jgi:hypothetical protein